MVALLGLVDLVEQDDCGDGGPCAGGGDDPF